MRRILYSALLAILSVVFAGRAAAQGPVVFDNGVVNAASFVPFGQPGHPTAPGSIVAIFGTNLASTVMNASTIPLSGSLGGVSVFFDGIAAPLFYVSPGQINAQLPWETNGILSGKQATVTVVTSTGTSQQKAIEINQFSPGIFTTSANGSGQGAVLFSNTSDLAAPAGMFNGSRPAAAGDDLTIFCNGLGPVSPVITDGNDSLDSSGNVQLRHTVAAPTITVGGVAVAPADVSFSGLAPQFVGLNQVNFRMPSGVSPGNAVPITITIGGVTSRPDVTIAVR